MKNIDLKDVRKKNLRIGIRLSKDERAALDEYCRKENISITNFIRIALRKVVNEKEHS
ncbi:ribbon-helix-helix protein, CopG family [Maribellus comscasis]|uniref:Ribbon-helix-helix protein, CopG family n=1 Tax=Maribellus comscasis TaxID=2681766 RepID=A0A6I6JMN3_9BACT|nr:ribbon-helix-helix protein, CopG family [Maribellus comscasis]QGY44165.1 ribbon-helix-helix protein, CopG family [Maribellus comscasis]